ncbi:uncharacterized protein [Heptranchias perlo]|uniref:uncharacterized protein n=1 Tax=Heptranchias perlo TaxID=212740 RepID=UPI00355A4A4F
MREIILYIVVTFSGTVWNVQPGLTQAAEVPIEGENCIESGGQQSVPAALQNVSIFSMNPGNCPDHFPIRLFQIDGEKTEQELSASPKYRGECKMDTNCQGFQLCCPSGTFSKCVLPQNQVGIDYYLGWVKLKVSEMGTNRSSCDYLDLVRNASVWLTAAHLTHNVSDVNVHVLCPEMPSGDQQHPVLGFILVVRKNYSLDSLRQAFQNLTNTSEYVCDVKLGEASNITHPGNKGTTTNTKKEGGEQGKMVTDTTVNVMEATVTADTIKTDGTSEAAGETERSVVIKEIDFGSTRSTSTAPGVHVALGNVTQETWSSNATSVATGVIQGTMGLDKVTVEKSQETHSVSSTWVENSTADARSDTQPGQSGVTPTVVPTETLIRSELATDIAATITTETAFTAFRASVLITNWNFTKELDNEASVAYRKLEKLFMAQLSQLLTEAAEVALHRTLEFIVVVEGFRKGSVIVDSILLTHIVENVSLADMSSVLISAVNQSLRSQSRLSLSYGSIEDFDQCENNICVYNCKALGGMYKCTCLNGLNGNKFACTHNNTSSCGEAQAVIPNPLVGELEKMAQFLDFANNTGCSFSGNTSDTHGILHVKDLCLNITNDVTDLWLEWKTPNILHLVLEGPNITVCQFSVSPKQLMIYRVIDSTDGIKGSFLVGYVRLNNEQSSAFGKNPILNVTMMRHPGSFAFHENESLNVTVSVQSGLGRNPKLFVKNCNAVLSPQEPEGNKLIEDGCPVLKDVSIFFNGNSSSVLLSVKASVTKNSTFLRCELQICAEDHCACTRDQVGKRSTANSQSFQENYIEIGPITVLKSKAKEKKPNLMMVILISVGAILLVVLLIGFLRLIYRRLSGTSCSTRILKMKNIWRRQSSLDAVALKSWKRL